MRVVPPACSTPPLDVGVFLDLLRIELVGDGLASVDLAGDASSSAFATITLEVAPCVADAHEIKVGIHDASGHRSVRHSIHLGDVVPAARPRALALAVAEFLRASSAELASASGPPPMTSVPEEPQGMREGAAMTKAEDLQAREGTRAGRPLSRLVSAAFESRAFIASGAALFGGRFGISLPLGTRLRSRLDGGALYGSASDPLGEVELALISGRAGVALSRESDRVMAEVGPRIELGWGGARGRPSTQHTRGDRGSTFVATASLAASLRVRLVGRLWAVIEPELGGVLHGFRARADGRTAAGLSGAMGVVGVGVALGF